MEEIDTGEVLAPLRSNLVSNLRGLATCSATSNRFITAPLIYATQTVWPTLLALNDEVAKNKNLGSWEKESGKGDAAALPIVARAQNFDVKGFANAFLNLGKLL